MLKIAIVEDDAESAKRLRTLLGRFSAEYKEKVEIECFCNGLNFISDYTADYDVVFMDIEMPLMNGIEAAKKLRERDSEVALVFLTVMSQYAIMGYEVGAAFFLLKPVKYAELSDKLRRILERRRKSEQCMIFSGQAGFVRIPYRKITYVESLGHWCIFHISDGSHYRKLTPLKKIEEVLKDENFLRSGNSYLVNAAYVEGYSGMDVVVNGVTLPISRSRRKEFVDSLTRILGED